MTIATGRNSMGLRRTVGAALLVLGSSRAHAATLTALQRIAALEGQVAALQTLLASVSLQDGGATLRVIGVNVQIVSGSGATDGPVNGTGNLIIGYNENRSSNARTGSHNLMGVVALRRCIGDAGPVEASHGSMPLQMFPSPQARARA